MKTAAISDTGRPKTCFPLTSSRKLADCPVANRTLLSAQRCALNSAGFTVSGDVSPSSEPILQLQGNCWISANDLERLKECGPGGRLQTNEGELMATISTPAGSECADRIMTAGDNSFMITYPWNLLRLNKILLDDLEPTKIDIPPSVNIRGDVTVGTGTVLLPGVFIEGNAVIGSNCKIGPNCYIRGSTSIGNGCHIGQAVEIKNSILMDNVSIGHISYCGDSIAGENCNFGAGTIIANFRHDGKNHRSMVESNLVDTERRKFGAVIGDDVHTGIHTAIYPGRKLWPHTWTRPGQVVDRDITNRDRDCRSPRIKR